MQDTHEILVRSRGGDIEAFRQLVEHYQGYAFALALRMLCNEENARDVVQETFIRVWKHLPKYDQRKRFTTWLYTIVTNLCYDSLAAQSREGKMTAQNADTNCLTITTGKDNPEREIDDKELVKNIGTLVSELSPKQRMVFVLRDLQNLSIKEVSHIIGMSTHSVKTNLYYARQNIRRKLETLDGMEEKENGV